MNRVDYSSSDDSHTAWFCVRSQPKHEHIAAANLRRNPDIDVLNLRIRFKRSTRRGPVWVTDALFPGYVLALFDLARCLRLVRSTGGVTGVVHFGYRWPTVPSEAIAELRAMFGDEEVRVIGADVETGDVVRISGGVLDSLEGVVTRVMPGRKRVAVLLDFLGRQTAVEVNIASIINTDRSARA